MVKKKPPPAPPVVTPVAETGEPRPVVVQKVVEVATTEADPIGVFVTLNLEEAFQIYAAHYGMERARAQAAIFARKPTTPENTDLESRMLRDTRRASGLSVEKFVDERMMPPAETMDPDAYERKRKALVNRLQNAETNKALDEIHISRAPNGWRILQPLKSRTGRPRKDAT
jgi:hypothetical protein